MVGGCFRFVVLGWNVCRAEGRSVFLVGRCVGEWVDLCFVIEVVCSVILCEDRYQKYLKRKGAA